MKKLSSGTETLHLEVECRRLKISSAAIQTSRRAETEPIHQSDRSGVSFHGGGSCTSVVSSVLSSFLVVRLNLTPVVVLKILESATEMQNISVAFSK